MSEPKKEPQQIAILVCGPPKCEHVWDGPGIEERREGGGGFSSATCSKCGVDAMTVSLWEGP